VKRSMVAKMLVSILLLFSFSFYAQGAGEYTLFVGEFENKSDVVNPMLSYLTDTLDFLFSRSKLARIHPISPGVRSAYLRRAQREQPNIDPTQLNLLAAGYGNADAVLAGSYTKVGDEWTMTTQLFVMREGSQAREDIQLAGGDVYRLLDNLAAEVSKRLGAGQYVLLSTKSWEAYEAYRRGHQSFYYFDTMGAINHFRQAIELDPHLAIAQAELGLSHAMFSQLKEAASAFAEATKNLQYASEQEQLVVKGLESFYRYYWVLKKGGGGLAGADMPRMHEDTVWNEPWLYWYIGQTGGEKGDPTHVRKQWLVSALAYSKAGFYGVAELVNLGANECIVTFDYSKDQEYLDAAIQFISQAADLDANDEYGDVWKHGELANVYEKMGKSEDAQQHRTQWLEEIKRKPMDSHSPESLNDFARNCLTMGVLGDAFAFASKAIELESDPNLHVVYLVTMADVHRSSGNLTEAFNSYAEAFDVSVRGDASTGVLSDSLSGLAQIVVNNRDSLDDAKRTKLDEIINTIRVIDPMRFRAYSAGFTIYTGGVFPDIRDFCHAMEDMEPLLELIRGLLKEEKAAPQQLVYISTLILFSGSVREHERNWLSSPDFIQSIADLNSPMYLGWVYEMLGEWKKAVEIYREALKLEAPETRVTACCALMSLGEEMPSQPHIYLEAEEAENITPHFEVAQASETVGGRYLWAPDTFDGYHDGKGQAEYEFEVSQPGTYRLLARMMAEISYADCVRVSVGNSEADVGIKTRSRGSSGLRPRGDTPESADGGIVSTGVGFSKRYAAWEWVQAGESFTLPAGKHRLVVHNKDDGVKLDCMVLYREK